MDHDALKLLQQTAIGDYNGKQERLKDTGTIALPNNFNIHDLERYKEFRRRFRGALTTNSLADFVRYTREHASKELSRVFIDGDKFSATAIIDLGTLGEPEHAEHTATLKLDQTAAFAAALKIDGAPIGQRDLVDWIQDWSEHLSAYGENPGEYKAMTAALDAVRNVKITKRSEGKSRVEDFGGSRSTFDEIAASADAGLPGGFLLKTAPYTGLAEQSIQLRLAVLGGDDDTPARLNLRIVRKDLLLQDIVEDFKRVLLTELGDGVPVTIGTFKA